MSKSRIVITILLLIAIGASFCLPWLSIKPEAGDAAIYCGCTLAKVDIQKYTTLAAGVLSCLLVFANCRGCRIISLIAALIAVASAVCIYLHIKEQGTLMYGFYILAAALVLQLGNIGCKLCCKCEACCAEKKDKPA